MLASVAVPALLACHAAQAQQASSVVLYGLLDTGLEYIGHAGPDGGVLRMSSGNLAGSRWGLRAREDLGGGLSA
ncbi:porin, partial [Acinetobacter baumannii]